MEEMLRQVPLAARLFIMLAVAAGELITVELPV
jgi:hypothetical protein